jgi:CRISPR-associated protein Csd1
MLHLLADYARDAGLTAESGFTAKEIRWLLLFKKDGSFSEIVDLAGGEQNSRGLLFSKCPVLSQGELISGSSERSQTFYESAQTVALMFKADDDDKVKNRVRGKHAFFASSLADCAKHAMPELANIAITLSDGDSCAQIAAALKEKKAKPTDTVTIAVDFVRPLDSSIWHDWWRNLLKTFASSSNKNKPKKAKPAKALMLDFITGEAITPCSTQGKISGLSDVGGLSAGDVFIGFDKKSFCSFGFEQGENAAISETNATVYREALNHLIKNHSRRLGKSKVAYWYKGTVPPIDDPIAMLAPSRENLTFEEDEIDQQQDEAVALARARKLLEAIKTGEQTELGDAAFYVMVLSGASGRIMIRDWIEGQFGQLAQNVADWFEDFEIVARDGQGMAPSPKFMAVMGATVRDLKELNTPFVAAMLRAALGGHNAPIPQSALAAAYARFKIDLISINPNTNKPKPFNHARMGLIKAYHLRKKGGVNVTQELNELSNNVPYQCGRLMALLADIQRQALPDVGTGVVQRYYAAASTTPALVFGRLIRNSNAHLDKIGELANLYEGKLAEVWDNIEVKIPKTLTLEEQTLFAMGYYQQIARIRKQIADAVAAKKAKAAIQAETKVN